MAVSPEKAKKVYNTLAASPMAMMPVEIAEETGIPRGSIHDALYELAEIGAIARQGQGKYVCAQKVTMMWIEAELAKLKATGKRVRKVQPLPSNKERSIKMIGDKPHPVLTALARVDGAGWAYCPETGRVTQRGMERRPVDLVNAANELGGPRIQYPGAA